MSLDQHRDEARTMLAAPPSKLVILLDVADVAKVRAFAEASVRQDFVNGCVTSPVAFLEGIYVRPEDRGSGIGRRLLSAVQSWALEQGCNELASDAHLENTESHAFHAAIGFEETERVVFFRKVL